MSISKSQSLGTRHVIIIMALIKLGIHLLVNNNYGLHRDEYLYIAEGNHLGWGYMEGPPMIGLFAWVAQLFGASPFVIRLIPTLIGVASVVLIGQMVRDLGGKKFAVFLACLAFIISPSFLRSNMLFQPVSFNQFFWLLTSFWLMRIVIFKRERDWYYLGLSIGLGLLAKYSIIFFVFSLLLAMLLTKHRNWFKTKYPYLAVLIATILFLPNLIWQWQHQFPVIDHMKELTSTQLVHVDAVHFFVDQFQNQLASSVIWLTGLFFLLFSKKMKAFRMFGFAYLILLALIFMLGGKTYYTLGIYPMLFVFGGMAIDQYVQQGWVKALLVAGIVISNVYFSPYAVPVLPIQKMQDYCAFMKEKYGLEGPLRWEDGSVRELPQDYADMFGWEEIAMKVGRLYHSLPDSVRQSCHIYGGGYAHAGAINYYREKYNLPEAHSMNASFMIWAPTEIKFDNQILIDDRLQDSSTWFYDMELVDSIENQYARDPGYIYYRSNPRRDLSEAWREFASEYKSRYKFN